jgi:hypothetical protein
LGFGVLEPPYQVLVGLVLALLVHEPLHLVAARLLGLRAGLSVYRRGVWVAVYCRVEHESLTKYIAVALSPLAAAAVLSALEMYWALPVYLSTMVQDFRAAMWAVKKMVKEKLSGRRL